MSQFRVDVDNQVTVKVKFKLQSKGTKRNFEWTMPAEVLNQEQIDDAISAADHNVKPLLRQVIKGWSGQRLVLDQSGEPAAFCEEAFDVMLGHPGVAMHLYTAYLNAIAPSKN